MKPKFPVWLVSLTALFIFFAGYLVFLGRSCNNSTEELSTIQGSPNDLSCLSLELTTFLSARSDVLTSTVQLGNTLKTTSSFHEQLDYPYYSNNPDSVEVLPIVYASYGNKLPNKKDTFSYSTISSTVPFGYQKSNGKNFTSFPYIEYATPTDLTVHYSETCNIVDANYDISTATTAYMTLDDETYFSITDVSSSSNTVAKYTLHGGIFKEARNSIECVYDYTVDSSGSKQILDLITLDDLHCLGLLTKEENDYILHIVDPLKKQEKKAITLATVPEASSNCEYLMPGIRIWYNSSSSTLTVSLVQSTPNVSSTTTEALICYKLEEDFSYKKVSSYDCNKIKAQLTKSPDIVSSGSDYLYHDGILYAVCKLDDMKYGTPYLIACKEDTVIYEGFLTTSASDDYKLHRNEIISYQENNGGDVVSYYSDYSRTTGRYRLSIMKKERSVKDDALH